MLAIVIDKFEEAGSVRHVPEPELESQSVLVRVNVAGVNPVDWKARAGQAGKREFPLVLGQDFAGVVERVGTGVTKVAVGDRIFGTAREHGSYAEHTLISAKDHGSPFARIPDGLEDEIAAALPTPALTALASLDLLSVSEGSDVLIVGAAGAVGTAAVQMARLRGAIVTAVVKPGQGDAVRALGAERVVEAEDDLVAAVRADHPNPFAAVLDLVSDADALKAHTDLYAAGGKLVTTIHVADEAWFRERGVRAINVILAETPASSTEGLDTVAQLAVRGKMVVSIASEHELVEAAHVLDEIESGKLGGKVVLRVQ